MALYLVAIVTPLANTLPACITIVDRTQEHLGASDKAIIAMRRVLLQAARSIGEGVNPPGTGSEYYKLRAIDKVLPSDSNWRDKLRDEILAASQKLPSP